MPIPPFTVGQVLAAADLNEATLPKFASKPADTSRSSTTSLTNDPDLTLPVDANKSYRLEMCLLYTAVNATGDLKLQFTIPASTLFNGTAHGVGIGGSTLTLNAYQSSALLLTAAQSFAGGGVVMEPLRFNGVLTTSSTAGSITLQWAQSTSNGTPTVIKAGSYILLRRVS